MSTYALKSIARRSSMFGVAIAVFAAAIIPAASVFADALNPLTERSLLLTSSAPGFQDTDGSGNAVSVPVGQNVNNVPRGSYAPPGSGPNGKKSGQTFTFKVSSTATVKAFSLQYCTTAAGVCQAPGDNAGDARDDDPAVRMSNADAHVLPAPKSDLEAVGFGSLIGGTDYKILVNDVEIDTADYGTWTVASTNAEDTAHTGNLTGKDNFISLVSDTGLALSTANKVQIKFIASDTKYITNPGSGSFFVKINTYSTDDPALLVNELPANDPTQTNIIDGGVTVANVMTDSIHITTKVLETMSFSVGTENPDNKVLADHGTCQNLDQPNNNRLNLGNVDAEYSLETGKAYDVNSYWRLSSNSSGGATVYYSGNTLANTVGDEIAEIGATAKASLTGTEQFGLAFLDAGEDAVSSSFQAKLDLPESRYKKATLLLQAGNGTTIPQDIYLAPAAAYAKGTGDINKTTPVTTDDAEFAFLKSSNTVPVVIAQNNQMVISCATAKMRYIANIGADTPAGVYTTKINYLAAPQY